MSEPLTTEPLSLRAGDAIAWTRDLPSHRPGDGWTLKYRLLWQAPPSALITAAAYGALHLVALPSATTATYQAGRATLLGWVERGADRVTLLQATLDVQPDLTAAASLDGRTPNQRSLADARAALDAAVASGRVMTEEYTILGRRMKFRDLQQIRDLIAHYERQVARDNAAAAIAQGVSPGRVVTRF